MDKNLVAFLAAATCGTITDASKMLSLTQPSVTKRIANLENELGARLFERDRRGISLTEAGKVFYRRARRIEAEYRQSSEEIDSVIAAGLSTMRVGAGPLFHLTCVASLFAALREKFPSLKLELQTQTHYDSGRMLSEGEIDVYLGIIPKEQLDSSIFSRFLTDVEHGLILRADDPKASKKRIDPSDLADYTWVSFAADPETESRIQEYSLPKGANSSLIDIRTTSFATGLQLVSEARCVMSAPLQLAKIIEREGLVVRPARQGMPKRRAGVHLRKSAMEFTSIQAVLEFFEVTELGF